MKRRLLQKNGYGVPVKGYRRLRLFPRRQKAFWPFRMQSEMDTGSLTRITRLHGALSAAYWLWLWRLRWAPLYSGRGVGEGGFRILRAEADIKSIVNTWNAELSMTRPFAA